MAGDELNNQGTEADAAGGAGADGGDGAQTGDLRQQAVDDWTQRFLEQDRAAEEGADAPDDEPEQPSDPEEPEEDAGAPGELSDIERSLLAEVLGSAELVDGLSVQHAEAILRRFAGEARSGAADPGAETPEGEVPETPGEGGDGPPEPEEDPAEIEAELVDVLGEKLGKRFAKLLTAPAAAGLPPQVRQQIEQQGQALAAMTAYVEQRLAQDARAELAETFPQLADQATFERVLERTREFDPRRYDEKRRGGLSVPAAMLRDAALLEIGPEGLRDRQKRLDQQHRARGKGTPTPPAATRTPAAPQAKDARSAWLEAFKTGGREEANRAAVSFGR